VTANRTDRDYREAKGIHSLGREAIHLDLFLQSLEEIRQGRRITTPRYDFVFATSSHDLDGPAILGMAHANPTLLLRARTGSRATFGCRNPWLPTAPGGPDLATPAEQMGRVARTNCQNEPTLDAISSGCAAAPNRCFPCCIFIGSGRIPWVYTTERNLAASTTCKTQKTTFMVRIPMGLSLNVWGGAA